MTRTVTITIPGRPPTPNARRHWRKRMRDDAEWKSSARISTLAALPPGWEPMTRCRMTVEFVVPDRRERDDDNLIAAQKPCLDGIVAGGAIKDDGRRVIVEREYLAPRYEKGVSATVYTFTELEDAS